MTGWRLSVGVAVVLAANVEAGAQDVYLKHGEVRFRAGEQAYQYTLRPDSTSPSINAAGVELRLVYEGPVFGCCAHTTVQITLYDADGLRGPGTYENDAIHDFSVEWLPSPTSIPQRWLFNPAMHQDRCVFTLTRLASSGINGSVTCSGAAVPVRDMNFTATP